MSSCWHVETLDEETIFPTSNAFHIVFCASTIYTCELCKVHECNPPPHTHTQSVVSDPLQWSVQIFYAGNFHICIIAMPFMVFQCTGKKWVLLLNFCHCNYNSSIGLNHHNLGYICIYVLLVGWSPNLEIFQLKKNSFLHQSMASLNILLHIKFINVFMLYLKLTFLIAT